MYQSDVVVRWKGTSMPTSMTNNTIGAFELRTKLSKTKQTKHGGHGEHIRHVYRFPRLSRTIHLIPYGALFPHAEAYVIRLNVCVETENYNIECRMAHAHLHGHKLHKYNICGYENTEMRKTNEAHGYFSSIVHDFHSVKADLVHLSFRLKLFSFLLLEWIYLALVMRAHLFGVLWMDEAGGSRAYSKHTPTDLRVIDECVYAGTSICVEHLSHGRKKNQRPIDEIWLLFPFAIRPLARQPLSRSAINGVYKQTLILCTYTRCWWPLPLHVPQTYEFRECVGVAKDLPSINSENVKWRRRVHQILANRRKMESRKQKMLPK